MNRESEAAVDQARRLLEDARLFHLTSIPLPVSVVTRLIELSERGLATRTSEEPEGCTASAEDVPSV